MIRERDSEREIVSGRERERLGRKGKAKGCAV